MKKCLPIIVVLAIAAVSANAAISPAWVYDGEAAGYDTYLLYVDTDSDWTNARIEINLTAGAMNHVESTGMFGGPEPDAQSLVDTGGLCPNGNPLVVADWDEFPQLFELSWGDTPNDGAGHWWTFVLTMSQDSTGSIILKNYEAGSPGIPVEALYGIRPVPGDMIVPEPATMALMAFGGIGVLLRKKR